MRFPPALPPTGNLLHLGLLHNVCFFPPSHAVFYTGVFYRVLFPPASPPTGSFFTPGVFLQCTVSPSPTGVCTRIIAECILPLAPLTTDSFYTWGFLHNGCFSSTPTCGFFYTGVFLQSAFFPPAPPPTGSFLHWGPFTMYVFISLPYMFFYTRTLQNAFFLRPPCQLVIFYTWDFTQGGGGGD